MSESQSRKEQYDDIIHLPHHQSTVHPHMSRYDRAAQFAPFAALTGHDAAIKETARLTDTKIELDDETKLFLSEKLNLIAKHLKEHPEVSITYFLSDKRKSGGAYITQIGVVKKIDEYEQHIHLFDQTVIPIADLFSIEGTLFEQKGTFE